ncbi:hypothetical protein P7C70_g3481, partial [Phenoliferia sp. Uapishka_3]
MESLLRSISTQAGVEIGMLLDTAEDDEKTLALEKAVEVLLGQKRDREKMEEAAKGKGKERWGGALEDIVQHGGCTSMPPGDHRAETNMSLEKDRFVGASSGPAFAKNILKDLVPGGMVHPPQNDTPSIVDVILQAESNRRAVEFRLPPADLSAELILAYFQHVNTILPIVHRPSFERAIAAGMLETDPSFRRLVLMIFALGARFHKNSRIPVPESVKKMDASAREHAAGFDFFMAATGDITSNLTTSTLFDIQNSVLGVVYCLGATTPLISWQRVGFAKGFFAGSITLHREFITPRQTAPLSFPSIAICSNAARSCVHVLDHLRKCGLIGDLFWLAPLDLATAGMILTIILIRQGRDRRELESSIVADTKICIDVLNAMAPSTCMAMKISKVLTRLIDTASVRLSTYTSPHDNRLPTTAFARSVLASNTGYDCIEKAVQYSHGDKIAAPSFQLPTPPRGIDSILTMSPLSMNPPALDFSSSSDSSSLHSDRSYGLPASDISPATFDPLFGQYANDPTMAMPIAWDMTDFSMLNSDEGDWGMGSPDSLSVVFNLTCLLQRRPLDRRLISLVRLWGDPWESRSLTVLFALLLVCSVR